MAKKLELESVTKKRDLKMRTTIWIGMLSGKGGGGNTVGVEVEGEDAEEEEHAGEQEVSD